MVTMWEMPRQQASLENVRERLRHVEFFQWLQLALVYRAQKHFEAVAVADVG